MTNPYRIMCSEILAWAEHTSSHYYKQPDVLNRARALLAQPVAEGPTDAELEEEFGTALLRLSDINMNATAVAFARAVLARWGHPAPQPVAVSERLPGPDDVNAAELEDTNA